MKTKLTYLLMIIMTMAISLAFTSCGDDDDSPVNTIANVEVTNIDDSTIRDLRVVHVNNDNEPVKRENLGDIAPGETYRFTSEYPKIYFMIATTSGGAYTANYELVVGKTTKINLDLGKTTIWMD